MRAFIFIFVFFFSWISALDQHQELIVESLEFLPNWCCAEDFFQKEPGQGEFPETIQHENGEKISLVWRKGSLDQVSVYTKEGAKSLSYQLFYDREGRLSSYTLFGNLTGRTEDTYTTELLYDEIGNLVERREQSGRSFHFSYPETEEGFFVATDTGGSFRKAFRELAGSAEKIEDDGTTQDILDLNGASWRKWIRITASSSREEISWLFGAYDLERKKEVVLRREHLFSNDIKIFDAQGALISTVAGSSVEQVPLFLTKEEFVCWKNDYLRRLQIAPKLPPKRMDPLVVETTSRGQPTRLFCTGGKIEEREYSLDGFLIKKTLTSGTQICFENDLGGRPLVARYIRKDGSVEKEVFYSYRGAFLEKWEDTQGCRACFERDVFGRLVHIFFYVGEDLETEVLVSYDAMDRPIYIQVFGETDNWWLRRSFSVDGQTVEYTLKDEKKNRSQNIRETLRKDGSLEKKEEKHPHQTLITFFDEQERVVQIDREQKGKIQTVFWKEYDQDENGNIREKTTFNNGTKSVQTQTEQGKRIKWTSPEGKQLLEETVEGIDSYGSFRLQQRAGSLLRTATHFFTPEGRLQSVETADGGSFFYFYGENGQLTSKKNSEGKAVYYESDEAGRVSRMWSDDETVDYRFFYDSYGRISSALDCRTNHEVIREFDQFGRLLIDGETKKTCSVSYADHGEIEKISFPDGSFLSYQGEKDGALLVVRRGLHKIKTRPPKVWPYSGSTTTVKRENRDFQGKWRQSFSFDTLQQLCQEEGEFNETHLFSPIGTLEKLGPYKTTNDSAHRVVQAGPVRAQYNQEGNMVSRTSVFDACSYEYDALGRLCRVCSELGEEELYRYDAFNRLQEITVLKGNKKKSYSLLWFDTIEMGSLSDKGIEELKIIHPKTRSMVGCEIRGEVFSVGCDEKGSVIALYGPYGKPIEIYRYSAFGQMHGYDTAGKTLFHQPLSPWLYCGKRKLFVGYDFGTRRYDPVFMRWFERDPLGMTDTIDDRQFVRNNPVDFFDPTGLFSWPVCLQEAKDSFFEAIDFVSSNTIKTLTFAREKVDWYYDIRGSFEHLFFRVLSKTWFLFVGYNPDDSACGVCGKGKEKPNVRITAINGMLNGLLEAKLSAQMISETHGDAPVHFIYSATRGFTGDMIRAFFLKVGVSTKQSQMLSKMWKKQIQEIGGADGGGEIIHYAHSLGAIDTLNALKTLSIEERKMIRVVTFGSPTLLPDGICLRVDNFISTKDGVPFFDFRRSWSDLQNLQNVHVLQAESSIPFMDHLLEGKTYKAVLDVLGREFQERYRLPLEQQRK